MAIYGNNTSELIWGTNSNVGDFIFGQGGNDTIEAGWGDDQVFGGDGDDALYGQGGNNRFGAGCHGRGNDFMEGGDGWDTVDYSGSTASVVVNLEEHAGGVTIGDNALWGIEYVVGTSRGDILIGNNGGILGIGGLGENWIVAGGGNDEVLGLGGNDVLEGNEGHDGLDGGDGDDRLFGQAGNDRLVGGRGNDYFDGGAGSDTVSYSGATEGVRMYTEADLPTTWGGSEGSDTFFGVENLVGSSLNDILTGGYLGPNTASQIDGGAGNDYIYGYGGNDTLNGGAGDDTMDGDGYGVNGGALGVDVLTGGAGSDDFEWREGHNVSTYTGVASGVGAGNRDIVTDFEQGVDQLTLFSNVWDANTSTAIDYTFIGQGAFTAAAQVRVAYESNNTIVQGNADGDAAPEFEIQLTGYESLTSGDFLFL